jgi:hypothetical protein
VRLRLVAGDGDPVFAMADADGRFRFSGLTPGRYQLQADRPGYIGEKDHANPFPIPLPVDLTGASRTAQTDANGVLHGSVTVRLIPGAVITGRVTDPNGVPMVGVAVTIRIDPTNGLSPGQQDHVTTCCSTDDLGEFRAARLPPGTYYVGTFKTNWSNRWEDNWRTTWFPHSLRAESAAAIQLKAGQQARADIQVMQRNGVRVAGRATAPSTGASDSDLSTPIHLALIPETNSPNDTSVFSTASPDGEFELPDVFPGRYVLTALVSESSDDHDSGHRQPTYGALRRMEIGDQGITGLAIELQPLRGISGTVSVADGCTAGSVRILASSSGFTGLAVSHTEAVSGPDGSFTLSGLAPGTLTISATGTGPGAPGPVVSARLGDRDVLAHGFDYPFAADASLKITMACGQTGRPK